MRTIFKYPIPNHVGGFTLEMPAGGSILTAQAQGHEGVLWVNVDTEAPRTTRKFRVCFTGNGCPAPHEGNYIATYQLPSGLVCHLFEVLSLDF